MDFDFHQYFSKGGSLCLSGDSCEVTHVQCMYACMYVCMNVCAMHIVNVTIYNCSHSYGDMVT